MVRAWCVLYILTWRCARATTACTFSTSQLLKVLRAWCVLYILTWKRVSRHNGVRFFVSHLATWPRTRPFSEPTFRPSGATNHWKTTVFRDFPTFSHTCIFFLLVLSLLLSSLFCSSLLWLFPPLLFHLPIFSEVWLLSFIRLFTFCSCEKGQWQFFGPQFSADPGDKESPEEACPPTNTKISQAWRPVLFSFVPGHRSLGQKVSD